MRIGPYSEALLLFFWPWNTLDSMQQFILQNTVSSYLTIHLQWDKWTGNNVHPDFFTPSSREYNQIDKLFFVHIYKNIMLITLQHLLKQQAEYCAACSKQYTSIPGRGSGVDTQKSFPLHTHTGSLQFHPRWQLIAIRYRNPIVTYARRHLKQAQYRHQLLKKGNTVHPSHFQAIF